MLKVELNKKSENPFFGLRNSLEFYQNASKGIVNIHNLNNVWNEVRGSKEHREMFFSILFSIGDITARQHNIFGKSKSERELVSSREKRRERCAASTVPIDAVGPVCSEQLNAVSSASPC